MGTLLLKSKLFASLKSKDLARSLMVFRVKSMTQMIYNLISLMCSSYSAVRNAGIASTGEQCLGQQWGQLGVASAAHPYVARGYKGAP